jgi:hypothetical protein
MFGLGGNHFVTLPKTRPGVLADREAGIARARPFLVRLFVLLAIWASACGGSNTTPTSTVPRVLSVTPNSGTTLGGTAVTITGANFTAGATVTIGGAAANDVIVVNAAAVTATTSQHAAGIADVVVTVGAQSGSLPRGFTYIAPTATTNLPPSINGITAKGTTGPREPAGFASFDEIIIVSAEVVDAETPISGLTFDWTSDVGTFAGSEPTVTWGAPRIAGTVTLTLTVTETFRSVDDMGLPVTRVNQVRATTVVRVHDSIKEVSDLAFQFIEDFSKQLEPVFVTRNFSDRCNEAASELADVQNDQRLFTRTSYTIGVPMTTVLFSGTCPFRNRFGDACAQVPAEWHNIVKATGMPVFSQGIDQVTAIFEDDRNRWRLCASDFNQSSGTAGLHFKK